MNRPGTDAGPDGHTIGWAASPSVQLTEQFLGVKPVEAGYRTWSIAPNPGPGHSGAGAVPTAYGTISTQWTNECGLHADGGR